jgi:hypothetical protein
MFTGPQDCRTDGVEGHFEISVAMNSDVVGINFLIVFDGSSLAWVPNCNFSFENTMTYGSEIERYY